MPHGAHPYQVSINALLVFIRTHKAGVAAGAKRTTRPAVLTRTCVGEKQL